MQLGKTLRILCDAVSRSGKLAMSSDSSSGRVDVSKILKGTSDLDLDQGPDSFVRSAYHVDKRTLKRLELEIDQNPQRVDPSTTSVILFPGQGAQFCGMAKNLLDTPTVKEMFDYASSVMKLDVFDLCCKGPEKLLNMTINCQAAILVTSLAMLEKFKHQNPHAIERCRITAGFSVGEYAALVFAGVLKFEEAVQIIKLRGEAMQSCAQVRQSGLMTAFLSFDAKLNYGLKLARCWCKEKEGIEEPVCEVASYLFPDCKVIGGDLKALDFLRRNSRDFGIKRTKRLEVSGAFHTKLMKPAKNVLRKALEQVELRNPSIEVVSNVTARVYGKSENIRDCLIEHVYKPVQWEQTMHRIFTRNKEEVFPLTYEVGPGNTLRPMLKALNQKAYNQSYKIDFLSL